MKIDILTLDFSLGGGIERVVSNMAWMMFDYSDYNVRIVSVFKKNEKPVFCVPRDVEVVYLSNKEYNLTTRWKKILSNIHLCRALCKYSSDAVIISTTTNITQWLSILNKTRSQRVIAAEHGYYWAFGRLSRMIRKLTYRKVDAVVTLTKSEMSIYKSFVRNVYSIPNSLSFVSSQDNQYQSRRVIAAGRAVKEKCFDQLLDIYALLAKKYNNWSFDLYSGEGYLLEILREKAAKCPQNVHLYAATKDFKSELLKSEIYVCTSYTEAFSMVIIEAMSCGVCPVSYKCPPGPLEIIDNGTNGILVDLGNKEKMVEQLSQLIEKDLYRMTLGRKAKMDSVKYMPENIFAMWDKVLKILPNDSQS